MPGPQVKDWPKYEALRRKGYSKESAARIANSQAGGEKQGGLREVLRRGKRR
jgi:hypothetical protein